MTRLDGTLLLPGGAVAGTIEFGERIERVEVRGAGNAEPLRGPYVAPGFIDVHVHGGGGGDTMDGAEGARSLARFHLSRGTTTVLPTTMTNPWSAIVSALRGVGELMAEMTPDMPDVLGAHLEGPFINAGRLGAQPPDDLLPAADLVAEVIASGVVRVVTLAPELDGALDAAKEFARAGVRVSYGHTLATAEQAIAGVEAVRSVGGTPGFTHLYNAMSPLASREPGTVGAAMARPDAYAELILDLHHVHPVAFRAALAAKPGKLLLITDAIRAAGLSDGETDLGGQRVTVVRGAARLADGTLAGSVLTMDKAVRNAVASGLSVAAAVALATAVPADYLGLNDRGRLVEGARADLVVLDDELRVEQVHMLGRQVA
ncbi:MAG TPA: N-acetylglucosamine-6-phosphate deacetylase [Trueperaceae bacterium]|nr:N-acetylglucosamine-6-phosphate deacetylase [Trueperaceae bacterium]